MRVKTCEGILAIVHKPREVVFVNFKEGSTIFCKHDKLVVFLHKLTCQCGFRIINNDLQHVSLGPMKWREINFK